MEVKLSRADIVIIASSHNPSIVSPQWLKDNRLLIEEARHFVHTPDFSLFESESFSLVVDHQRLQITAKKQNRGSLESLANIASGYVKLLPHIPYRSLGLNFLWNVEIEGERAPEIKVNINESDLLSIFKGHRITCGAIVYARKEPYLLKLIIERQGENTLVHNFNYHHTVQHMSAEDIVSLIDKFLMRYSESARIVEETYPRKEK